jgi:hypothetical protein
MPTEQNCMPDLMRDGKTPRRNTQFGVNRDREARRLRGDPQLCSPARRRGELNWDVEPTRQQLWLDRESIENTSMLSPDRFNIPSRKLGR